MIRREEYRAVARFLYENVGRVSSEHIKIPEHANVQPVGGVIEDGAFVEALIWIPVQQVDRKP